MLFCVRLSFSPSLNLSISHCNAYTRYMVVFQCVWTVVDVKMMLMRMLCSEQRCRGGCFGFWWLVLIFAVLHALHTMRSSHDEAVHLSLCLSVCQTRDLWQNDRKLFPHHYTTWTSIYPSFMTRRMVGWGRPLISEIVSRTDSIGAKTPIFSRYSFIAPQL